MGGIPGPPATAPPSDMPPPPPPQPNHLHRRQGPAREWQTHLALEELGARRGAGSLDAAAAARLFEGKLRSALLADDGRLALSRLAGSTVRGLLPRIESSGAVGGATWRLVSAPAISGLLDPGAAGGAAPGALLGSITLGTEVEVAFGRKLTAALVRGARGPDTATRWSLTYALGRKVRVQFNISSAPPYARTLSLQYSSEGAGGGGSTGG